ncbi:hypothetical protein EYF80_021721 [Liparis tanakae]|uniref:Uncharacterized protein n=1 Tax=Liparis tanakae TaxID=230148 RepID=A0A4Z2HQF6_9TELE|nr:hypothetical protein EYF80_021721 [Liparis tanakae]
MDGALGGPRLPGCSQPDADWWAPRCYRASQTTPAAVYTSTGFEMTEMDENIPLMGPSPLPWTLTLHQLRNPSAPPPPDSECFPLRAAALSQSDVGLSPLVTSAIETGEITADCTNDGIESDDLVASQACSQAR